MYNRYLDQIDASELTLPQPQHQEEAHHAAPVSPAEPPADHRHSDPLGDITSSLSSFLGGFLKNFSLEQFDTGDILLVLIILFLFLEGDNLELVITLGLMLLLGLSDD